MGKLFKVVEIHKGRKIDHEICSTKKQAEIYLKKKVELYKNDPNFKNSEWKIEDFDETET